MIDLIDILIMKQRVGHGHRLQRTRRGLLRNKNGSVDNQWLIISPLTLNEQKNHQTTRQLTWIINICKINICMYANRRMLNKNLANFPFLPS
jgi:hypothetical protein